MGWEWSGGDLVKEDIVAVGHLVLVGRTWSGHDNIRYPRYSVQDSRLTLSPLVEMRQRSMG